MAADTMKINQSVQMEGTNLKKSVNSKKNDEGLFEEFISSLMQKIRSTSDSQDEDNALPEKVINELLQGMAFPNIQSSGLSDLNFSKGTPAESASVNIASIQADMLSMMDGAGILDNEGSLTTEEGIAIDDLSEYALKALEYLQQKNPDAEIQSLPDSMNQDINENDVEDIKNLFKQYGAIEEGTENISDVMGPTEDIKSLSNEKPNLNNEQKQLNDLLSEKPEDIKDEKYSATFIVQEKNIGSADIGRQTMSPIENTDLTSKTSDLSQENIDKIVKSFKTLRLPDSTEISVKLTPEELGEVTVRVVLEKGHVTGHITAESREVALMLENKLYLLKQEMTLKNVNLSDISVSVFTGQGDGSSRQSSRDFLNRHGGRAQNHQGYIEETGTINDDEHDTSLNIIA